MATYLVQDYLDNTQAVYPSTQAVNCGNNSISYNELFMSSNQLANCLINIGVSRQDRVIFCLKRSIECIVTIFGILKADAVYVPVDPKSPSKRLKVIVGDCKPSAIICDETTIAIILEALKDTCSHIPIVTTAIRQELPDNLDGISLSRLICRKQLEKYASQKPVYNNIDTDTAYILYTSGSTGTPKGVMISHLNITNYIDWAVDCFDITDKDRLLNTAPFHFDMSTFEVYCAAKSGASLCIAQEIHLLFPNKLMSLIEEQSISIWKAISSLIMYLAKTDVLKPGRIPSLKKILFGGETLSTKYLIKWMLTYPEKTFFNAYGPTEATGISLYCQIKEPPDDANTSIPIGKACANSEALLLKDDNSPAGAGEIGMLYIRGSCLSKGYWNDIEKTENEFITNPFTKMPGDRVYRTRDLAKRRTDELYEFIGRQDSQVKLLGYRIELHEIEKAIMSIDRVNDAAVILVKSELVDIAELAAFVETEGHAMVECFMSELEKLLPRYMLPQLIFPVRRIPRTNRGKVDRDALLEHYARRN